MKSTISLCLTVATLTLSCAQSGQESKDGPTNEDSVLTTPDDVPDAAHNSRNSLDWNGTYSGTIPCADCEGIQTILTLKSDLTYNMQSTYLGKSDNPFEETGAFVWSEDGGKIALVSETGNRQFLVGENRLVQLDSNGNLITGDLAVMYVLQKTELGLGIEGPKWILFELMGESYEPGTKDKTPSLVFNSDDKRVNGNGGCNTIFGGYMLTGDYGITLENMASTMMACEDMTVESKLLEALSKIDRYAIQDGVLSLQVAENKPIARFKIE